MFESPFHGFAHHLHFLYKALTCWHHTCPVLRLNSCMILPQALQQGICQKELQVRWNRRGSMQVCEVIKGEAQQAWAHPFCCKNKHQDLLKAVAKNLYKNVLKCCTSLDFETNWGGKSNQVASIALRANPCFETLNKITWNILFSLYSQKIIMSYWMCVYWQRCLTSKKQKDWQS